MYIYFNFNGENECKEITDDTTTLIMLVKDDYNTKDTTIKEDFDLD
jgi:hypothetical protein